MPLPFPGMNPYLENPDLWPEVHHILISLLAETLNPQLLPIYRVAIEKRVYQISDEDTLLVGIPDVTVSRSQHDAGDSSLVVASPPSRPVTVTMPMPMQVREGYLEVREVATQAVVTVIEVLSPANKRAGTGRDAYVQKRNQVLSCATHLVEIDLLRSGEPMSVLGTDIVSDYRILVSRSDRRPTADLYPFSLQDAIPSFPLPLKRQTSRQIAEPVVELDPLLQQVIDRSGLSVVLDYSKPPNPPLDPTQSEWMEQRLRAR